MSAHHRTSKHSHLAFVTIAICAVLIKPLEGTVVQRYLVPHDVKPGHLVTQLSNIGQKFKILKSGPFADYFKIDNVGKIVTTQDIASLAGEVSSFDIENMTPRGTRRTVIHMHVQNAQDSLVFPKQGYTGHVREHAPLSTVVRGLVDLYTVSRHGNSDVKFVMIAGDSDKFGLKQSHVNGAEHLIIVTKDVLDRDVKSEYDLVVQATDEKGGSATTKIHILVEAEDAKQSSRPTFESTKYKTTIPDVTSPESLILFVKASDPDHNQVHYKFLTNPGPKFRLDQETGGIYLGKGQVNPGVYAFRVVAVNEENLQSNPAKVVVTVAGDVQKRDDGMMVLRRSKRAVRSPLDRSVKEDATGIILTIPSQDAADVFALEEVAPSEDFLLSASTGSLTMKPGKKLDYETTKSYTMKVKITRTNAPSFSDTQMVNLQVEDVNDTPPRFTNKPQPMIAVIDPNALEGRVVYTLSAEDSEPGAAIEFIHISGGESHFKIDKDKGTVSLTRKGVALGLTSFILAVKAVDVGAKAPNAPQETEAKLTIYVGDHQPQFFETSYTFDFPELSGTGKKVGTIKAKSFNNVGIKYELTKEDGTSSPDFRIETTGSDAGSIYGQRDFKYEIEKPPRTYKLKVTAVEDTTKKQQGNSFVMQQLKSTMPVAIKIIDINNYAPSFPLSAYMPLNSIPETDPIGTTVLKVTADDLDSGDNSKLTFSLDSDLFSVVNEDPKTAVIKIAKRLDYDRLPDHKYKLTLTAVDGGTPARTGSTSLIIPLANRNDEEPIFLNAASNARVDEDAPIGTNVWTVQATDIDGSVLKYSFTGNVLVDPTGTFKIDPGTGIIETAKEIDKNKAYYTLSVESADDGSCTGCPGKGSILKATTRFQVEVMDVNNHNPVFPNCATYAPTIYENEQAGTKVTDKNGKNPTAEDDDSGSNGQIVYSIKRPQDGTPPAFNINATTGEVTSVRAFDREMNEASFTLTVRAADKGTPSLEGYCAFTVTILDRDDNIPFFLSSDVKFDMNTNTPIGPVLQVYAKDMDTPPFAKITFVMTKKDTGCTFSVNKDTGVISLDAKITLANNKAKECNLEIEARDTKQNVQNWNTAKVLINIKPGGARPVWVTANTPIQKPENVAVGTTLQTYQATGANLFALVSIVAPDYVYNAGSSSGKQPPFRVLIKTPTEMEFRVNDHLDYEQIKSYDVVLRASNSKVSFTDMTVTLNVVDMNDNSPNFPKVLPSYTGYIAENVDPAKPDDAKDLNVITMAARDIDTILAYRTITYEILPEEDYQSFKITENAQQEAIVSATKQFDRELIVNRKQKTKYRIKVQAKDGAPSANCKPGDTCKPNFDIIFVEIDIVDKNDQEPEFSQKQYTATVAEDIAISSSIVTVTATDKDEMANLRFSIIPGNVAHPFEIRTSLGTNVDQAGLRVRKNTGTIYVAQKLDYDIPSQQKYNLTVRVFDGKSADTAYVVIYVTDVNDNPPKFDPDTITVTNVTEGVDPPGGRFLLAEMHATDIDKISTTLTYSISGVDKDYYYIDPQKGLLYLVKKVDRENTDGSIRQWMINVEASDGLLSGYATVKLIVQDVNDNAPVFTENSLKGSINENSPIGTPVLTLESKDADAGVNAQVEYRIVSMDPALVSGVAPFKMQGTDKVVVNSGTIDRDGSGGIPYIKVVVEAKDKGSPSLSATATATVTINDVNDNDPRFTQQNYQVTIPENLADGTTFFSVSATDADLTSQGKLSFTITNANARATFGSKDVHVTDSAILFVFNSKNLDFEKPNFEDKIIMMVKDEGQRSATTTVTVKLLDINDNAPICTNPDQTVSMVENLPVDTEVAKCPATDGDAGLNGQIMYEIALSSDKDRNLAVSSIGTVTIAKNLDREKYPTSKSEAGVMNVLIRAYDKGSPSLTGTCSLTISILDENDNCPGFAEDYRPVVMENVKPKSPNPVIVTLLGKDPDNSTNGPPFTMGEPANTPTRNDFSMKFIQGLDKGNGGGEVRALLEFDREKQKYYLMPVIMTDSQQVSCTNTLTITIGDENDNPVKPGHKEITIFNYEGKFEKTPIGTVYAEDKDDWDKPAKVYGYKGTPLPYFTIDEKTGEIALTSFIHEGTYTFEAWVNDTERNEQVVSTVEVKAYTIPKEPVFNAASFRIKGMTAEQFIEKPKLNEKDPKAYGPSPYQSFQKGIADTLKTAEANVEMFTVNNCADETPCTDVRYSAHGSPYYKPARMDGLMNGNKDAFNKILKNAGYGNAALSMSPTDLCLRENCEAGCSNVLTVTNEPKVINANSSSLVGVTSYLTAKCGCKLKDVSSAVVKCTAGSCFNGGTCKQRSDGFSCECPKGFDGPRCQMTKHQFKGKGWAWFPPLKQCLNSHTSVSFATQEEDGLIFYDGPTSKPSGDIPQDFIAVELIGGYPKVTIDHGSGAGSGSFDGKLQNGTLQISKVNDGAWHRLDIFRQGKTVRLVLNLCRDSPIVESTSGSTQDRYACEKTFDTPGPNKFININQVLQLGGRKNPEGPYPPGLTKKGFNGCIKDLTHDGELYDLYIGTTGEHLNSEDGCPDEAARCGNCNNGKCVANLAGKLANGKDFMCTCNPGYTGDKCDKAATIVEFDKTGNSKINWKLSQSWFNQWKDEFASEIRVMFRSRQPGGVIMFFKSKDSINEFMQLNLRDSYLVFQYNLGIINRELSLPFTVAANGEWHSAHVVRLGKQVTLKMDIGEGKFFNSTPGDFSQHQMTLLEGTVLGGADEYRDSCLQDPRYMHGWFPVISSESSEYATIVESVGVKKDCPTAACAVTPNPCTLPFVCVDKWRLAACECPPGQVESIDPATKLKTCIYVDPCLAVPCVRGICSNLGKGTYECKCEDGWEGRICNIKKEAVVVALATGAWVAILVCILVLLLLVILFVIWIRRKPKDTKLIMEIDPDDDIRENIVHYDEEGAGEEDFDGYDLSRLRKPRDPPDMPRREMAQPLGSAPPTGDQPDMGNYLDDRLDDADNDPNAPPHDTPIEYSYEGGGSSAGSLSSLQSSSSDEDQNYDYLNDFGPRFAKLADMYGGGED